RDDVRVARPGCAGGILCRRAYARTAIARRPPHVHPAVGGIRTPTEIAGVPLRRPHERLRVHAERRRGERPHPWMLPRRRSATWLALPGFDTPHVRRRRRHLLEPSPF